jgi:hypothetical protein
VSGAGDGPIRGRFPIHGRARCRRDASRPDRPARGGTTRIVGRRSARGYRSRRSASPRKGFDAPSGRSRGRRSFRPVLRPSARAAGAPLVRFAIHEGRGSSTVGALVKAGAARRKRVGLARAGLGGPPRTNSPSALAGAGIRGPGPTEPGRAPPPGFLTLLAASSPRPSRASFIPWRSWGFAFRALLLPDGRDPRSLPAGPSSPAVGSRPPARREVGGGGIVGCRGFIPPGVRAFAPTRSYPRRGPEPSWRSPRARRVPALRATGC